MEAEKFGVFLAEIRKEKGMTQKELAETINLASVQRKEEIMNVIKTGVAIVAVIAAFVAGDLLKLLRVSRIALFVVMMVCGGVLVWQELKRKKANSSYKLMLAVGIVWFAFWAVVVASCIPVILSVFI